MLCLILLTTLLPMFNGCEFSISGREWIVVGNFSKVYDCDGEITAVSNIARYDGSRWNDVANGTNGRIRTVYVDTCMNLYVGGEFTTASGVDTGPLAVLKFGKSSFEKVQDLSFVEPELGEINYVNDISADCNNIPTTLESCSCNVYIGGKFKIETVNEYTKEKEIAVNVARYSKNKYSIQTSQLAGSSGEEGNETFVNIGWDALGGSDKHFITEEDEVYKVLKENFGIQINSNSLYFSGRFNSSFRSFSLSEKNEEMMSSDILPLLNNSNTEDNIAVYIEDIYYNPVAYSLYDIIISGNFSFEIDENKTCTNICIYNYVSEEWTNFPFLGENETIHQTLVTADYYVVVGDSFVYKYPLDPKEGEDDYWSFFFDPKEYSGGGDGHEPIDLHKLYICSNVDIACKELMTAILGRNGYLGLWDNDLKEFYEFGQGTNGELEEITSFYDYYSIF